MPTAHLNDFSDRLSPMLVKELRQGLRARTFIAVFLSLQALLALILLSAAGAASYDSAGMTITRIIFLFFSLAVLVIQPLRGIGAVASEIKACTIDLMVLTRLSAWRIVFGKWIALVSQSALLLTAIVPYLILRYFFGEMELVGELLLLGCVFLCSMLLTAVTVGLSASPSLIIRGILPILGAPVLFFMIVGFCLSGGIEDFIDFFTFTDPDAPLVLGSCLALGLFIAWSSIDFGAGLIAPLAENRSTVRRLAALAFAGAWLIACLWVDDAWMLVALAIFLTPSIATAVTEPSMLLPVVCSKFTRFGPIGRLAGRLLYPGWPFVDADVEGNVLLSSWFGTLIFPALCILPFEKKLRNLFAIYGLIVVASFLFTLILALLADAMNEEGFLWVFSWLPATHILIAEEGVASDDAVLAGSIIWNGLMLLALVIASMIHQPQILKAEQTAIREINGTTATLPDAPAAPDEGPTD